MNPPKSALRSPQKKKIMVKRIKKALTEKAINTSERVRLEGMVRDGESKQRRSDEKIHRQTGELKTQSDQLRRVRSKQKLADEEILRQREVLLHVTRVGKLAEFVSSLAHEISQPLTAILAYAQAAQRMLKDREPQVQEILQYIISDNQRAAEVIRRLRSLLKKGGKPTIELIDLNTLINDTILLITTDVTIRKKIINTQLANNLPQINGDRIQLQQVILNLISNSLEAMEGIKDAREMLVCTSLKDSNTVLIEVKDSGCGIPEQNMAKLFTNFFTSKPDGLGMGLSISRSIVESHGGRLDAKNNSDRGANFYFTLPLVPHG